MTPVLESRFNKVSDLQIFLRTPVLKKSQRASMTNLSSIILVLLLCSIKMKLPWTLHQLLQMMKYLLVMMLQILIFIKHYKRVTKQNSDTLFYNSRIGQSHGYIQHYFKVLFDCTNNSFDQNCFCNSCKCLAIIELLYIFLNNLVKNEYDNTSFGHILEVSHSGRIDVNYITYIIERAVITF